MKLDNWQKYVKDNRLEPDYDVKGGAYLAATLHIKCNETYEYIMDEVEKCIEARKCYEDILDDNENAVKNIIKTLATQFLNTFIQQALEDIEDIESEQTDEQCDIELFKYERASND